MRSVLSYLFLGLTMLVSHTSQAQRNCGTVEYMNQLKNIESKTVFENWIKQKLIQSPSSGQESFNEDVVTVYQMPVVVHIIHNGEDVGTGTNISEAQIQSQLDALNEDYRKLNADSINIPAEFKHLYSDIGFEFILAKRSPNNASTNGIVRVQGSQTSWSLANNETLKALSYWPSEDYLNIWVAPLSGGWLGWAQYPQSDILDGLDPPYNETTDGVVITYNAFGSIIKDPTANLQSSFDRGRTATHEIGHFFGLRHIWGDGGCTVDDYVDDTPLAENFSTACPNMGGNSITCGSQDMFMNYMDYVDDDCMNIFSLGQKDRMVIIMENSPRRLSLTNSLGLIPPNSEDLALTQFITPDDGICNDQLTVITEVKNVGVSFINTSNLSLYVNEVLVANQDFEFKLGVNESIELSFFPITLTDYGNLEFRAVIEKVNGTIDSFEDNNTVLKTSLRAEPVNELHEDFSAVNPLWTVRTDQEISFLEISQSVFYSITNNAAVFDYYKNDNSSDAYISPKLSLGSTPKTLIFDYAYGYRASTEDIFTVVASIDCGNTFSDTLFIKSGESISTITNPVSYFPEGAEDWNHIQVDLSPYQNKEVIFAFSGKSTGGNRILFDNIQVVDAAYSDIALIGLTTPLTICNSQNEVILILENKGSTLLQDLNLSLQIGTELSTIIYPQINLIPGQRIELPLVVSIPSITSEVMVSLTTPDDNSTNDSFTQSIIPATSTINIPMREQFTNSTLPKNWNLTGKGTDQNQGWAIANNRLEFIAANSPAKGVNEMIILPPLNLTNLLTSSMHFDFAYAFDGFNEELLRVKASNNCGESYETLFIQGGEDLATNFTTTPWVPTNESDWKDIYVDLSDFAGSENVQVVIELISGQGNNAFVNNIELYASNVEEPLGLNENTITIYPNPSSDGTVNISFNLDKPQAAKMFIYNAQGGFVFESEVPTALNQTFEVNTIQLKNGIYFARLIGDQIDISRSFMVNQ